MVSPRRARRSLIAACAIASLGLAGCSGTQEAARQAGDQVGQAAKEAASTTGQEIGRAHV